MIHVVLGPPASGKSTWVRQHAQPHDVVIDFDLLAAALSAPDPSRHPHDHPGPVRSVTHAARTAAIDAAFRLTAADAYLIHSDPSPARLADYQRRGARVHVIDPGQDVVLARCARERPPQMAHVARRWYATRDGTAPQPPAPHAPAQPRTTPARRGRPQPRATTTARGYGTTHRRDRDRALAALTPGQPCPLCRAPMYHPHQPLDYDHVLPIARGGRDGPKQLTHASCNRSKGAGLTLPTPQPPSATDAPPEPEVRATVTSREW